MLKEVFSGLMQRNAVTPQLAEVYWRELAACYGAAGRHYHTLGHLSDMLLQLRGGKRKGERLGYFAFQPVLS